MYVIKTVTEVTGIHGSRHTLVNIQIKQTKVVVDVIFLYNVWMNTSTREKGMMDI